MLKYLAVGLASSLLASYGPPPYRCDSRLYLFLIFLASSSLAYIADETITSIYHARNARRMGCQPVPQRKYKIPGGLDMIYRMIKADNRGEVPEEFVRVSEEMGCATFGQHVFGTPTLLTTDPKNIQAILATQFHDFEIGDLRKNNFFPLLGNGIFTADGKLWEHSRALLRPQFTRDQVGDLELEEHHVQDMFKHLPTDSHGWTTEVDLPPLFFRLTLDSATEFLFGESVQSQLASLPNEAKEKYNIEVSGVHNWDSMASSFDSATHHLGKRARFAELYWIHSPKGFFDDCKNVHKFADYYVNLALTTDLSSYDQQYDSEKGTKKPRYVFLRELVKATRDPTELRSQLLHILLAGRDTTAGLLGWTFWLLVRHPEIYAQLRKTILDDFGSYTNPQNITFATLKSCAPLQRVLNEALRLYPSVPLNSRRALKNTTLPRGGGPDGLSPVYVRKDCEVNYGVHIMHRRKDVWGADADEFRPDRWIGRKTGWEYLPFNGGPRICLGQQFALTEAGYVIVRMLQKFDRLENLEVSNRPKHQYSVTTSPAHVRLRLHEAQD